MKKNAMSSAKESTRKRVSEPGLTNTEKRKRAESDLGLDLDLSNDIKGIISALNQIREKAHKDGKKKNEDTISSVASEVRSMMDELKSKCEKERHSFAKALSKSSKECENCLKNETAKFRVLYENFCKEKVAHLQALQEMFSKFEEDKGRLLTKYEQLRKREKSMITEHEKTWKEKIGQLEESMNKKKQDDKTFSILRKSLGSFLEPASDDDFPPDD